MQFWGVSKNDHFLGGVKLGKPEQTLSFSHRSAPPFRPGKREGETCFYGTELSFAGGRPAAPGKFRVTDRFSRAEKCHFWPFFKDLRNRIEKNPPKTPEKKFRVLHR